MDTYARVAKSVEPKKQALALAEKQVFFSHLVDKEKNISFHEIEHADLTILAGKRNARPSRHQTERAEQGTPTTRI